jgi:methylenetetrahydrofolate reductase (NADPH)
VITSEVRAPRDAAWARLDREAAALAGVCDAVNATSFLNGQAALPSALVAARLAASGIEAVVQLTGRDHTRATAAGEALAARAQGVGNALCLTGDWGVRAPALAQPVFALDAALLVRELAALDGEPLCLGVAANPDAEPVVLQVRRLMQKAAAGATFVQTQVVTDAVRLARFTDAYAAAGLDRRLALVVGIPVVLSPGAQAHLGRLPGVRLDPGFAAALAAARDPVDAGIAAALSLARQALALPGVRGVHLMRFGGTPAAVADTARALRAGIPQTISQEYPCPSPA